MSDDPPELKLFHSIGGVAIGERRNYADMVRGAILAIEALKSRFEDTDWGWQVGNACDEFMRALKNTPPEMPTFHCRAGGCRCREFAPTVAHPSRCECSHVVDIHDVDEQTYGEHKAR